MAQLISQLVGELAITESMNSDSPDPAKEIIRPIGSPAEDIESAKARKRIEKKKLRRKEKRKSRVMSRSSASCTFLTVPSKIC